MTDIKTNTVITIDLKEYARLKGIKEAGTFIINNRDKFQEHDPDGVKKSVMDTLAHLLDGDK